MRVLQPRIRGQQRDGNGPGDGDGDGGAGAPGTGGGGNIRASSKAAPATSDNIVGDGRPEAEAQVGNACFRRMRGCRSSRRMCGGGVGSVRDNGTMTTAEVVLGWGGHVRQDEAKGRWRIVGKSTAILSVLRAPDGGGVQVVVVVCRA